MRLKHNVQTGTGIALISTHRRYCQPRKRYPRRRSEIKRRKQLHVGMAFVVVVVVSCSYSCILLDALLSKVNQLPLNVRDATVERTSAFALGL